MLTCSTRSQVYDLLRNQGLIDQFQQFPNYQWVEISKHEQAILDEIDKLYPNKRTFNSLFETHPLRVENNTVINMLTMSRDAVVFFNTVVGANDAILTYEQERRLVTQVNNNIIQNGAAQQQQVPVQQSTQAPLPSNLRMHYNDLIARTNMLINQAELQLQRIEREIAKHPNDKQLYAELIRKRGLLKERLNGNYQKNIKGLYALRKELKSGTPELVTLQHYFEMDMLRVQQLLSDGSNEDLVEAKRILDFYKELGIFNINKGSHILFENDEVFGPLGNVILDPVVQDFCKKLASQAEKYNVFIDKVMRERVKNLVLNDKRVQRMYKPSNMSQQEINEWLFATSKGLPDISFLDSLIMDTTNGIMSKGHIIPQMMMLHLTESVDEKSKEAALLNRRLDSLKPQVEEELRKMGYSINFLTAKGVSYDIFRQKDKNGNYRDGLCDRFTQDWLEKREEIEKTFAETMALAFKETDLRRKKRLIAKAHNERAQKLRENSVVMRPAVLEEIISDPEFASLKRFFGQPDAKHRQELIDLLGDRGYAEYIEKQKEIIRSYIAQSEVELDRLFAEEQVDNFYNLTKPLQDQYKLWEQNYNPFIAAENFYNGVVPSIGNVTAYSANENNVFIPRKYKVKLGTSNGVLSYTNTTEQTDFYDQNFEVIEKNDVLREFHSLTKEILQSLYNYLPPDQQDKLGENAIPALQKNLVSILMDPTIHGLAKLSEAFRYLLYKLKSLFAEEFIDDISYAHIDPITHKEMYQVSTSWLKTNRGKIKDRTMIELIKIREFAKNNPALSNFAHVDLHNVPSEVVVLLAQNLGCEPTVNAIQNRLPNSNVNDFNIEKELRAAITHQIVAENTFDLPKILKLYNHLGAVYAARQEALPILNTMKYYYDNIKKATPTSDGRARLSRRRLNPDGSPSALLEDSRHNAQQQMESWFQRSVLGNYNSKIEFGDTRLRNVRDKDFGRVLSREEKKFIQETDEAIAVLQHTIDTSNNSNEIKKAQAEIDYLTLKRDQIGRKVSVTAIFDSIMKFTRFKALGYNYKSGLTNYFEGQMGNMLAGASGLYFSPENLYRANNIVRQSTIKFLTFGKGVPRDAKKLRILMDRFNVLQDATNELQKASNKSPLQGAANVTEPFEMTRKVEYKNQSPVMLAILFDQKIKDINGANEVTVWDAMDDEGNLLPEYRTDENIATWELCKTDEYREFASKVTKTIVNIHGDYHELRGMMASEYMTGKALLMFKRWMPRYFYNRFATEQDDLEAGIKGFKGRYRSATKGTATLGVGLAGMIAFGPLGLAAGASVGYLMGRFFGVKTDLNIIQDLLYNARGILKAGARIAINSTPIASSNRIRQETDVELTDKFGGEFDNMDAANFRANMTEIALLMTLVALKIIVKATLVSADDDEDENGLLNKTGLVAVNQMMQMSAQIQTSLSPQALYKSTVASVPVFEQIGNMINIVGAVNKALHGEDTLKSGVHAGESNLANTTKKVFFPFASRLESSGSKQLDTDYFDELDISKTNKQIYTAKVKALKEDYRNTLANRNVKENDIEKAVRNRFRAKKKDETYEQYYNRISGQIYDPFKPKKRENKKKRRGE